MLQEENSIIVYDIETETFGLPDPQKDRLKFFGCYSYRTKKFYMITNKNDIQKIIGAHRYLVGFNNKEYDNIILQREGLDLKYKYIIDLMEIFRKRAGGMKIKKGMLGDLLMSYSLDFITKTLDLVDEGVKGKIDFNIFKKDEWTIQELGLIKVYLEQDIMLTKKLYEWCENYFESFKLLVDEEDVKKKHYLTDAIAVFAYKVMCRKLGLSPEFENVDTIHGEYEGGYVAYPTGERFENNLILFDYASLYPNIFIQCNLFSNKCNCCTPQEKWHGKGFFKVEGYYCSKQQGKVEQMYKEFYLQRKKLKKEKNPLEYAIKIILNAGYGLTGNPKFKNMYNRDTASDCTAIGRQIILYTRKRFKEEGYKNVFTDTDSICVQYSKGKSVNDAIELSKKIVLELQEYMPFPW